MQTHKYPQNWRKEVGGRRETLRNLPWETALCARFPQCRKSAPVTTRGFPRLPEGPAHILPRGCPRSPQAGANPLGAGLQTCPAARSHSFPAQLSPLAGGDTAGGCCSHRLLVHQAWGLLPEEAFTREEQMKALQKRTRNTAALGRAPALAGKLRHASEGMRVPLEDNQRFRVSPTSSCLQSQGNQKVGSPPPAHRRASVRAGLRNTLMGGSRQPSEVTVGEAGLGCRGVSRALLWPRAGQ